MVALIGVRCSNAPAENGNAGNTNAADHEKAVKFAECMRDNGVKDFPGPHREWAAHQRGGCSEQAGVPGRGAEVPRCLGRRTGGPVKRKTRALAGAAVLVVVTATGGVVVTSSAKQATPAAQEPPARPSASDALPAWDTSFNEPGAYELVNGGPHRPGSSPRWFELRIFGGPCWIRTSDLGIKSPAIQAEISCA
jgi:hypothetical protein